MRFSCGYSSSGAALTIYLSVAQAVSTFTPVFCLSHPDQDISVSNPISVIKGGDMYEDTFSSGTLYYSDFVTGEPNDFLSSDKFYPQNAFGIRYSAIIPPNFNNSIKTCFSFASDQLDGTMQGTKIGVTFDNQVEFSYLTFLPLSKSNPKQVIGPKSGTVCTNLDNITAPPCTLPDKLTVFKQCLDPSSLSPCPNRLFIGPEACPLGSLSESELCYTLRALKKDYDAKIVSPGIVESFIPYALTVLSDKYGQNDFFEANRTIYESLPYDPRAPLDATRRSGVFPKCSGKNCVGNTYKDHLTKRTLTMHDQLFNCDVLFKTARLLLGASCQFD